MGKRQITTTLLKIVALVVVAAMLKSCVLWGRSIEGTILDDQTKKPLSGVHVVAIWKGVIFAWVDSQDVCVHMEATTTDKYGHFQTNRWIQESHGEGMKDGRLELYFYKPGYDDSLVDQPGGYKLTKRDRTGAYFMEPYKVSNEERLKALLDLSNTLSCYKHDEQPAFQAQRDIYHEASALGPARLVNSIKKAAVTAYNPIAESYDDDLVDALVRNDSYLRDQLR